jgi:hypothetical protein
MISGLILPSKDLELNEVKTSKEFTAPMANTEIPSAGTAI